MKQYFAIIDTNVLVSALFKKYVDNERKIKSNPSIILDYVKDGVIVPYINAEIMLEYAEVLSRKNLGFKKENIIEIIDSLLRKSKYGEKAITDFDFKDKNDAVFYEVTLCVREETDAYLVTGNIKDFPREPYVVSPKEMIDIIESKLK